MERQLVRPVSVRLHADDRPGVGLSNRVPSSTSYWVVSPRVAGTYTLNPDNVLRASAGRYARAAATSSQEINDREQDLPDKLAGFYKIGYTTPYHQNLPDSSWNYDLSWEHHLRGTNLSFKISPFYRSTSNQVQYFTIDPATGIVAASTSAPRSRAASSFRSRAATSRKTASRFRCPTPTLIAGSNTRRSPTACRCSITSTPPSSSTTHTPTRAPVAAAASTICGGGLYGGNAKPLFINPGGVHVANPYYATRCSR